MSFTFSNAPCLLVRWHFPGSLSLRFWGSSPFSFPPLPKCSLLLLAQVSSPRMVIVHLLLWLSAIMVGSALPTCPPRAWHTGPALVIDETGLLSVGTESAVWPETYTFSCANPTWLRFGGKVPTAHFRTDFLTNGARTGRPRNTGARTAWCEDSFREGGSQGFLHRLRTPLVDPRASLPRLRACDSARVSWGFLQNPSHFTFQMGLFRVPKFNSHFYFKLLQKIKCSVVIFLLHLPLWSLCLFLFNLLSKNTEEDRGVLTEPQWGTRFCPLWGMGVPTQGLLAWADLHGAIGLGVGVFSV